MGYLDFLEAKYQNDEDRLSQQKRLAEETSRLAVEKRAGQAPLRQRFAEAVAAHIVKRLVPPTVRNAFTTSRDDLYCICGTLKSEHDSAPAHCERRYEE